MSQVQITVPGIKKALRQYKYPAAISEYIWNGFDAQASHVDIWVEANEVGNISEIRVVDNGYGVPEHKLKTKFVPFFESEKEIDPSTRRNTSAVHGKTGVGRLTFFQFASLAQWTTVYEMEERHLKYSIEIAADGLNTYSQTAIQQVDDPPGTVVTFTGIHTITLDNFQTDINDYLAEEFGWFLQLNAPRQFSLRINGSGLDYSGIIGDTDQLSILSDRWNFDIRYVRWTERLREYSRYYLIDSEGIERHKATTLLNNKGDKFYHSVYIQSRYLDGFAGFPWDDANGDCQLVLTRDETMKEVMDAVERLLRDKRLPFLKEYTNILVKEFERDGAFPRHNGNEWDVFREDELKRFVRELYQVEPKIFTSLNVEQKKTFVRLLDLIMDVGERDRLLEVLGEIVDLSTSEREQLAEILRSSRLSAVIKTIKLIEDRVLAIDQLRQLVHGSDLQANERDHVQKFIERHYWIFGEQYHLVTAAEPKFEEVLRRYIYHLHGETKSRRLSHPDKNKEMDIFMVQQLPNSEIYEHVVVELKHPRVRLGEKELNQVKTYLRVIRSMPEFNGENMSWRFFLVGCDFDETGYMQGELQNAKYRGEKYLVYSVDNLSIYVRKWSEIFADFELRHKFLLDRLELEREKILQDGSSANQIVAELDRNSAVMPPAVEVLTRKSQRGRKRKQM